MSKLDMTVLELMRVRPKGTTFDFTLPLKGHFRGLYRRFIGDIHTYGRHQIILLPRKDVELDVGVDPTDIFRTKAHIVMALDEEIASEPVSGRFKFNFRIDVRKPGERIAMMFETDKYVGLTLSGFEDVPIRTCRTSIRLEEAFVAH